jgi:hypothetical protein
LNFTRFSRASWVGLGCQAARDCTAWACSKASGDRWPPTLPKVLPDVPAALTVPARG